MSDKKNVFLKDESLDELAESTNVAQFVSYAPGNIPKQRYSRVLGCAPNHSFRSASAAIAGLLERSAECSVNVRSYLAEDPRSKEFLYGLKSALEAEAALRRLSSAGFYVIINETVDVHDSGVSGVAQGQTIEFSPDDTPRCVEKPGVASLPLRWGRNILQTVYGFDVELGLSPDERLEFSIHPIRRGWKDTHVLGWERERVGLVDAAPSIRWPNNFSRMLGDKVFGLLVAHEAGLRVPLTNVINRRVAPFSFGEETHSTEWWIRTCPREQVPGKYSTFPSWVDPFALLQKEDPSGEAIPSVIAQRAVASKYSGALIVDAGGQPIIEGKRGMGEALMRGQAEAEEVPDRVRDDVLATFMRAQDRLGPVRFEWVHDGSEVWVVQLHRGASSSFGNVIVPGEPKHWRSFVAAQGLEALRAKVANIDADEGIMIVGSIGITSHMADVLRKANVPARLNN